MSESSIEPKRTLNKRSNMGHVYVASCWLTCFSLSFTTFFHDSHRYFTAQNICFRYFNNLRLPRERFNAFEAIPWAQCQRQLENAQVSHYRLEARAREEETHFSPYKHHRAKTAGASTPFLDMSAICLILCRSWTGHTLRETEDGMVWNSRSMWNSFEIRGERTHGSQRWGFDWHSNCCFYARPYLTSDLLTVCASGLIRLTAEWHLIAISRYDPMTLSSARYLCQLNWRTNWLSAYIKSWRHFRVDAVELAVSITPYPSSTHLTHCFLSLMSGSMRPLTWPIPKGRYHGFQRSRTRAGDEQNL